MAPLSSSKEAVPSEEVGSVSSCDAISSFEEADAVSSLEEVDAVSNCEEANTECGYVVVHSGGAHWRCKVEVHGGGVQ